MDPKRRSTMVILTLIGLPAAVVAAAPLIPPEQQFKRNLYPDRAACERDYSTSQCAPGTASGAGGWHGPYFSSNPGAAEAKTDPGPGRTGIHSATESSTRGGFGAFGRAARAVG